MSRTSLHSTGREFYNKGSNVQLGPGMCVARVPRNGRNFEYISGEDPFLGYQMVQPVIKGIQGEGVVANAKHWVSRARSAPARDGGAWCELRKLAVAQVNNNQETWRGDVDEEGGDDGMDNDGLEGTGDEAGPTIDMAA